MLSTCKSGSMLRPDEFGERCEAGVAFPASVSQKELEVPDDNRETDSGRQGS